MTNATFLAGILTPSTRQFVNAAIADGFEVIWAVDSRERLLSLTTLDQAEGFRPYELSGTATLDMHAPVISLGVTGPLIDNLRDMGVEVVESDAAPMACPELEIEKAQYMLSA